MAVIMNGVKRKSIVKVLKILLIALLFFFIIFYVYPKVLIYQLQTRWWTFGKDTQQYQAAWNIIKIDRMGMPVTRALISELKNHGERRDWAIYILSRIKNKTPSAVGLLIAALKDKNSYVREGAARALGTFESKNYLDGHFALLYLDKKREKEPAFRKVKYLEAIDPLIAALEDEISDVRADAAISLGELGDRRAVNSLVTLLEDKNVMVRAKVISALAMLKHPIPLERLRSAVQHEDGVIRTSANFALSLRKTPEAAEALIIGLEYDGYTVSADNAPVDLNAEKALIKIGEPAIEPLIDCLRQEINIYVRIRARNALKKITAQNFGEDYNLWQKWWEEQ